MSCCEGCGRRYYKRPLVLHLLAADPDEGRAPGLQQLALLAQALDRHKAHVGPGDGFTDGVGIGRVVLAALAREARG